MRNCIACQKKQSKIFSYKTFDYYRCLNCQQVSTYPYPTEAMIVKHYEEQYKKGNYKLARKYEKQYRKVYGDMVTLLAKKLTDENSSIHNKKILDIGCYTGEFLLLLQERSADVYGLELQAEAVKLANKKLHDRVQQVDIMHYAFPKEKYDAITLLGLIEHVTNPVVLINKVSQHIKNNGCIMIQTPNSSSILARITQKYWPPFSPIEHIHLFSAESIKLVLLRAGFINISIQSHWKKLPVGYIYNMLSNFGPEFHQILRPFDKILKNSKIVLPFYGGEMIIIATKK